MSEFYKMIDLIRKEVNLALKNISIPNKPKYLYDPIRYSILSEGKRFRPILAHLTGKIYNIDKDAIMNIALAVELLHNFTLVHDDIMDNDTMRHGKKTIHIKWDSSTAILSGDGIYTIAQIILSRLPYNFSDISKYFNNTTLEICEGQALDKEFENNNTVTEEMYIDMIEKKTGALLGASAALPLIYNGEDDYTIKIYEQFGRCLGIGFQIHDDLLEITSDSTKMGKSLGSDIVSGKQTIMVIKARNKYPAEWNDLISKSNQKELINNVSYFFEDKGILEETKELSKSYFKTSLNYIKRLDGVIIDKLIDLIELIDQRTY